MIEQLVEAVRAFVKARGGEWEGTGEMLFAELTEYAEENEIDVTQEGWPANAAWLSRRLQGFKRELRSVGIEVERRKESSGTRRQIIRLWLLREPGEEDDPDDPDLRDPDPDDDPDPEIAQIHEHYAALRAESKAKREAEAAKKLHRGFVVRGDPETRPPWADDENW